MSSIVFDMDGLLLDTERVAYDSLRVVCGRFGVVVDDTAFRRMVGLNANASRAVLANALPTGSDIAAFEAAWDCEVEARVAADLPLRPFAREVVSALAEAGIPIAVATSTRRDRAIWKLEKAGLLSAFETIVCGDEVGRSKPAPDIFLEAARRLGTTPADAWAFEDSTNGVRAAVAAGFQVVQVPDLVPPDDDLRALGHHIVGDLGQAVTLTGLLNVAGASAPR